LTNPTPCLVTPKSWPAAWSTSSAASPTISLLLLTACGSSVQAVKPAIDASLPQPCVDTLLTPDEPSDNELAAERLRVGKAYLDGKARHAALTDRVT
jgi:hypothetical protein